MYGDDSCPSQLQSLAEDLQLVGQMDGMLCSSGEGGTDGRDLPVCICICGSAHDCGCVVDGSCHGSLMSIIYIHARDFPSENW